MKRTLLVMTMAIVAIFSQMNVSAQTSEEIQLLDAVVAEMQSTCKDMRQQTDGVITKATCARSGRNIVMNMYLGDKSVNFNDFDAATQAKFKDVLSDSFLQGILEGEDSEMAIVVFQYIGTKFVFNIYDAYNHKLSKTVDFNDIY